ncbi:hypothetical protein [Sphingomonas desiccabilis]|uniref:Uncharacterized protein n=1 Tax=Sphingomonas desiccabilis TaxID=429134 RepID=A0A4Q2J0K5_9SPHN|nr:hypothetical protein [Sphingomonas desiccabilis]MBB3910552.1 hypothetical protein [Sphingomonas desiccabilis]RXZ35190.1 hypothetical protein EO081_06020 [Sphingomonas desiccabilis]
MSLTLAFCRTQEARQLAIAAAAPLENSRQIANIAAAAWAEEATAAERADARRLKSAASRGPMLPSALPNAEDRSLSENPDRGFA